MDMYYGKKYMDYGANPYVADVAQMAMENSNFRTTIWTGKYAQMTLMSIPMGSDIGLEIHEDTDQLIRIEEGMGLVQMGKSASQLDFQQNSYAGDVIFVPAGTWHNVVNTSWIPLKVSVVYAPPHHPVGTVHRTKADAQKA